MVRKEFRHIFRDAMSSALLFVMPVLIILIFGYALSFQVDHFNVAVLNLSHNQSAERLFARIDANPKLKVVSHLHRMDEIDEAFVHHNTRAVVVFATEGIDIFLDAIAPAINVQTGRFLSEVISDFYMDEQHLSPQQEPVVRYLYNPSSNTRYMPVPGLILMVFMLVSSIVLGTSINREKQQGTFTLLRLTPGNNLQLIAGKSIPYFLISLLHVVSVYFVCGHFGIEIVGNLVLFFGVCVLFSLCCMSLGLLIGAWFDRPLDVVIMCWIVLFIPNIFLSGFIFPVSSLEGSVRLVVSLLPGTSFIEAFRSVAYKGNGIAGTLQPLFILLAETIIAFVISLLGLKWRASK